MGQTTSDPYADLREQRARAEKAEATISTLTAERDALIRERDEARGALRQIERIGERICVTLIGHLNEPVRRAFWDGVAIRDAARSALSGAKDEREG